MASNLFVSVNARRDLPNQEIVPTIHTSQCEWDKKTRQLIFRGARNYPNSIDVISSHTGVVHRFVADHDRAEQCEWWDGEMYEYKCLENDIRLIVM